MNAAGDHWRERWGFAIAVGAAVLLLAWSGGSPASGEGGTATASRAKTVRIVNFAYKPATLSVPRGTKVIFSNTSGTTHTASGGAFDTGRLKGGRSAGVKFKKSGTFAYHCKIHSFMKGKIIVG